MAALPYFIGVDWLQLFGNLVVDFKEGQHGIFTAKKEVYQTRHFKELYTIFLGKEEVAQLQAIPHSKIIDTGNSILKLNNKYLYQNDLTIFTNNLMKCLNFAFVSISRIDLNIDFEVFKNGYKVSNFLKDFTKGNIIKHGKNKFKLQGTQTETLEYDYLRFGSPTSNISTYIYNKSKELREVKNKPWIVDTWAKNGMFNDVDVYRLEFSIKKMNKNAVNEEDGTFIQMNDLAMLLRVNFEQIVKYLIQKIWKFSTKVNWQKTKEKYRCITIKFFDFAHQCLTLERVTEKKASNRMDKIFIKKLIGLKTDYGTTDNYFINEIDTIETYFRRTRGLLKYART